MDLNTIPNKINNVLEQNIFDEMVLYDQQEEKGFSLNSAAKEIWELCDGKQSIIKIGEKLAQRLGISDNELLVNELLSDVIETIIQLQSLGLLKLEGVPNESYR